MKSHAILNENSRGFKAKKIEALVHKYAHFCMRAMLEVGSGSGFIAQYFSRMGYGESGTHTVDVVDERQIKEEFQFELVKGTKLPYADETFDFIISNHVIEHVGSYEDQVSHISEIYRCLEPGGVLYFAVPNRWGIIEPHYRLPFLSWLPESWSSAYVRFVGRYSYYDCRLLSRRDAENLLSKQGFSFNDATLDAIKLVGVIEDCNWLIKLLTRLPKGFWLTFSFIMPTLIYVCHKPSN
jgi:SAM-dependent methyltransferase